MIFASVFSTLLFALSVQCASPHIRQTTNGPIEGIEQTTSSGQKYIAFRGVPFAEPPITGRDPYTGEYVDRRFKPTEPLQRLWNEPLKVHSDGKSCIQATWSGEVFPDTSSLSEDCLFLNLYIPADGSKRKTVLAYIHGGGFAFRDNSDAITGPDFLLSEDNIVVKIQYRLGVFGFLNLGDDTYTGNMGLKDQQLALKWIYENIENFSGNRDEILILGDSAGSASVHYHMLNEISRTYFTRAFAMSSSAFSTYALRSANHVQQIQECTQMFDMDKLIEHLKTVDSSSLVICYAFTFPGSLDIMWVPTIENRGAPNAFLIQTPEEIYKSAAPPRMDAMFSLVTYEALPMLAELLDMTEPLLKPDSMDTNIRLPFEGFTKDAYPQEYAKAVEKLRLAYFSNATTADAINRANLALMSDLEITDGVLKAMALQANANSGQKNTFLFRFSVTADIDTGSVVLGRSLNYTVHGADLCYIFQCHAFIMYDKQSAQFNVIRRLVKMITNFARTGDPSIEGETPFKSSPSSDEIFCQEMSNEPGTRTTLNIKEQLHYGVWREIEEIYKGLKITAKNLS